MSYRLETDRGRFDIRAARDLIVGFETLNCDDNNRAILSTSDYCYIQITVAQNGFLVEKRSGAEATHCFAGNRLRTAHPANPAKHERKSWFARLFAPGPYLLGNPLTREEARDLFVRWFEASEDPDWARWHQGYGQ